MEVRGKKSMKVQKELSKSKGLQSSPKDLVKKKT